MTTPRASFQARKRTENITAMLVTKINGEAAVAWLRSGGYHVRVETIGGDDGSPFTNLIHFAQSADLDEHGSVVRPGQFLVKDGEQFFSYTKEEFWNRYYV